MKIAKLFLPVVLAAAFVTTGLAQLPGGGMGGQGMSSAMMRVFGKDKPFRGISHVKISSRGQETLTMKMNVAVADGKFRSEMDTSEIKGAQFPPDAMAQMKMMGMDK